MTLKDLVLSKEEGATRRKNRPAKKLPAAEDATLEDIHREVAAAAEWLNQMGYRNIGPRLEWAARALLHSNKIEPHSVRS